MDNPTQVFHEGALLSPIAPNIAKGYYFLNPEEERIIHLEGITVSAGDVLVLFASNGKRYDVTIGEDHSDPYEVEFF